MSIAPFAFAWPRRRFAHAFAEWPIFHRFKTGYMGLDSPRLWMRLNLVILWEFDDVRKADKSLLKDISNGPYDRALGFLEDQKYSRFNDYIEDLNGFSNSDIALNGRTFF